ncbi:MAG: hypothetical protein PSN44_08345, partial [Gammaproteobacteria bacterium]|nr:hypothetical protein [Gammaproteobacteria bacterium]
HLDEVRHLNEDAALTEVLGLTTIPSASTLGAWLRKMGDSNTKQQKLPVYRISYPSYVQVLSVQIKK